MPRRGPAKKIKISPDPIYGDLLVQKLINRSMKDGKKSTAEKQVYGAFDLIAQKTEREALEVFKEAMEKIRPSMEVRARRVGGAAYQVPMPVRGIRQNSLAIRWIVEAARERDNAQFHTFAEKLAAELMDAIAEEGGAFKKKAEMERMAEANRAFSHFRW